MKLMQKKIRSAVAVMLIAAMVLGNGAIVFAAAPKPKLESVISSGTTTTKIYVNDMAKDVAGIQFDILVDDAIPHSEMEWGDVKPPNAILKVNGDRMTFYLVGDNLGSDSSKLYVGQMAFSSGNVTFDTTGYIKYLDSETANEIKQSQLDQTTQSGGSSGSSGSHSRPKDPEAATPPAEIPPAQPEISMPSFDDLGSHWAKSSISFVTEKGLMNGMGNNKFVPDGTVTRAMLVQILYNLEQKAPGKTGAADGSKAKAFTDVQGGTWYEQAVSWASANEIVSGVGVASFAPEQAVSREAMALMLQNYSTFRGTQLPAVSNQTTEFVDSGKISSWARSSVEGINKAGIINGRPDHSFDPQGNATRGEIATILERYVGTANISI